MLFAYLWSNTDIKPQCINLPSSTTSMSLVACGRTINELQILHIYVRFWFFTLGRFLIWMPKANSLFQLKVLLIGSLVVGLDSLSDSRGFVPWYRDALTDISFLAFSVWRFSTVCSWKLDGREIFSKSFFVAGYACCQSHPQVLPPKEEPGDEASM